MRRSIKPLLLALALAAGLAVGAAAKPGGGSGGGSTCWTICCDGGFPCISCCKGQACPDLICP
ncbi:MAG TPA: hypothetical protein VHM02_15530 [Thermoanaerobaculia bacterium]|nr:hypothetical protein [Thermoanaerobaculia bacterium]